MRNLLLIVFLLSVVPVASLKAQQGSCTKKIFTPAFTPERFVFRDKERHTIRLVGLGLSDRKIGQRFSSLAKTTDERLQRLMRDAPWSLVYADDKLSALGECLAYVQTASGVWIQEDLTEKGMSYVVTTPDDIYTPVLLKAEGAARRRGKGLWRASNKNAVIRDADSVRDQSLMNSYQVVEGNVRYIHDVGKYKNMCLAEDPFQSVCFAIWHTVYDDMRDRGIDLLQLSRRQPVRVRGHLIYRGGLKIFVKSPLDIQLVAMN